MTRGDNHEIRCPACHKPIHGASRGVEVQAGRLTEFARPCPHCGESIYYFARLQVTLEAERESKIT